METKRLKDMTVGELIDMCKGYAYCSACPLHSSSGRGKCALMVVPDGWPKDAIMSPGATRQERALLRALVTAYVSRDSDSNEVKLWDVQPAQMALSNGTVWGFNNNANHIGTLPASLFPSLKRGECWDVQEILKEE